MDDDYRIIGLVVLCVTAVILSCVGVAARNDGLIASSPDPIAAACAIRKDDQACVIAAMKR